MGIHCIFLLLERFIFLNYTLIDADPLNDWLVPVSRKSQHLGRS